LEKALNIALLTEVNVTKTSPYILFSVTKMMQLGWTLGGDVRSGIKMTKENQVLKFDMPIKTSKGVVYAMCINRIKTAFQVLQNAMTCKEVEHKRSPKLTQSVLPDERDLTTEQKLKNNLNDYGIEVPEDEDECAVTVPEDMNKCVEETRVNEERSEGKETEFNEEYQDNPIETGVGTTRSGARFREISAANLYARRHRDIAGGKEFGMHFDPGPQVFKHQDSIFCAPDDNG
jgi:hypothetical protein